MDDRKVIRCEYAAFLKTGAACPDEKFALCGQNAKKRVADGEMMTCALYRYGRRLFLYAEFLGSELKPESFLSPLDQYLAPCPGWSGDALWAKMTPVFWHAEPLNADEWRQSRPRERRRGRIALLKRDKITEYVFHHLALTREGVFRGDKYMFISLLDDTLFSYFEEPRSSDNVSKTDTPSKAFEGWLAVDPESHFIPLPGSNGQNFLLIDSCFDTGEGE